jgi:hypothetical protein
MPNRILRDCANSRVAESAPRRSRHIQNQLARAIAKMPCAVCGCPFGSLADHVIPFSLGGPNTADNIQPLCEPCNLHKQHRLTNADLIQWVESRGLDHFLQATYRHDTRFFGAYDGPSFSAWQSTRPDRVALAESLHADFVRRRHHA